MVLNKTKSKSTNDNHVFVFRSPGRGPVVGGGGGGVLVLPPRIEQHPNAKSQRRKKKGKKSKAKQALSPKEQLDNVLGGDSEIMKQEMARDMELMEQNLNANGLLSYEPNALFSTGGGAGNFYRYSPAANPIRSAGPPLPSYPARSSQIAHGHFPSPATSPLLTLERTDYMTKSKSMTLPVIHDNVSEIPSRRRANDVHEDTGMSMSLASAVSEIDEQSALFTTAMEGATQRLSLCYQQMESQKKEIRTLKSNNKVLNEKLSASRKRASYYQKKSKEFQSAATGNHKSAIQAETNATIQAATAKGFKNKYLSVQQALEQCREDHERIAKEENAQRKRMMAERRRTGGAFRQNSPDSKQTNAKRAPGQNQTNQMSFVRDSKKSAEKAYKRALMLLAQEKGEMERSLKTEQLFRTRVQKKAEDLELRLERAHAEIKRLRTLYKTTQKQLEAQRPPTDKEKKEREEMARKRPPRITKQAPLTTMMTKIFDSEPALLSALLQAREDGDADEIARAITRCRALIRLSDQLSLVKTMEKIATSVVDYLPAAMECEYGIIQVFESETETFWTIPRRSGERGYFPSTKKSISALIMKDAEEMKHDSIIMNEANYDRRFNLDVEADGVFGTVDTRCVISTPVVSIEEASDDSQISPNMKQRSRSMSIASKPRVISILQAFNKKLRPNTGLQANDLSAQATAASFDKIDEAFMNIAAKGVALAIQRVKAETLVEKQFSYLSHLSNLTFNCMRGYLPYMPSIEKVDPIKLVGSIEAQVRQFLRVQGARVFVVGTPPGHPAVHPVSGNLGSHQLEIALKSRKLSKALGVGKKKTNIFGGRARASENGPGRARLNQHRMMNSMLKVWHVREEVGLSEKGVTNVRHYTDLFSGITGEVLSSKKSCIVRDAYNDALFNGNSDLFQPNTDLISAPILDHNEKTIGVLQIAIGDLVELEYLSEMSAVTTSEMLRLERNATLKHMDETESSGESSSDDDTTSTDSEPTYKELREKERQKNISRYVMEMRAATVVEDVCAKLSLLLVHYRDVSRAMMHNVLDSEDELMRLFTLWREYKKQLEFEERKKFERMTKADQQRVMKEKQTDAAKRIQRAYRKHLRRTRKVKDFGATEMQRIVRGFLGRNRVKVIRQLLDDEQEALWSLAETADE
jgi:hypothetical protein